MERYTSFVNFGTFASLIRSSSPYFVRLFVNEGGVGHGGDCFGGESC